jgi:hypothetical protein
LPPIPVVIEEEDLFLPKSKPAVVEDDDLFYFSKVVKSESSMLAKTVSQRDYVDDDLSDLKVSKLLETEEQLDFQLFGKSSSNQRSTGKKKMDFDHESDFLRQLDEITSTTSKKASTVTPVPKASSTVKETASLPRELDFKDLDLNDYISQNSSSTGGLFD